MKDYEVFSNIKISKNSNVILRLDGRNFHNLSKYLNLKKPYDYNFSLLMSEVSKDIFRQFSPKFIYTFSDEINILLDEIPFASRIEKLNSVFSSIASSSFTHHLLTDFDDKFDFDKINPHLFPISFDSRIIPVIYDDIHNYFKWRQDESWRNCINSYGIWLLNQEYSPQESTKKIKGLKSNDIHDLLFDKGINLNNVDTWQKRGIGIYKKPYLIEGFNPIKNEKTKSYRYELFADFDLAIFNSNFFDRFFK